MDVIRDSLEEQEIETVATIWREASDEVPKV